MDSVTPDVAFLHNKNGSTRSGLVFLASSDFSEESVSLDIFCPGCYMLWADNQNLVFSPYPHPLVACLEDFQVSLGFLI